MIVSNPTGGQPTSLVVLDISGDGKPDIVTANFTVDTVSVLLGNGNGTFQTKIDYATGARPYALAAVERERRRLGGELLHGIHDTYSTRLRARFGEAFIVHRLDLDVSGLLLVAKDASTHAALQAQFARRQVDKRYVAIVEGALVADGGTIDLPIRVDVDDRPRQIIDPAHGKPAVTEWRVTERDGGRSRVELVPRTGRTHQLRVHCAHPDGLAAPIVGDRLYGRAADRLLLHAEAIAFIHPHTARRVALDLPAPF